jgi:hypothetical protein
LIRCGPHLDAPLFLLAAGQYDQPHDQGREASERQEAKGGEEQWY